VTCGFSLFFVSAPPCGRDPVPADRWDGQLIDRDYRRVPLRHAGAAGTAPGQRVETDFELPVPAEPGHYTARLDLVAEQVCWFEVNGSQPAVIRLTVT